MGLCIRDNQLRQLISSHFLASQNLNWDDIELSLCWKTESKSFEIQPRLGSWAVEAGWRCEHFRLRFLPMPTELSLLWWMTYLDLLEKSIVVWMFCVLKQLSILQWLFTRKLEFFQIYNIYSGQKGQFHSRVHLKFRPQSLHIFTKYLSAKIQSCHLSLMKLALLW